MQFRVSGSNKQSGSRMTLDIEANSRGSAERKASQLDMDVHKIEPLESAIPAGNAPRTRYTSGLSPVVRFFIALIVLSALAYIFRGRLHSLFGH